MKITPSLFEAFLKCPTKCWLRSNRDPAAGNAYTEWVQTQTESYRSESAKRLTVPCLRASAPSLPRRRI